MFFFTANTPKRNYNFRTRRPTGVLSIERVMHAAPLERALELEVTGSNPGGSRVPALSLGGSRGALQMREAGISISPLWRVSRRAAESAGRLLRSLQNR